MIERPLSSMSPMTAGSAKFASTINGSAELGVRFEQMFWAEMLSQAGFEKALTQSGGEGVASFARFLVESVAADLAESRPLGFAEKIKPVALGE